MAEQSPHKNILKIINELFDYYSYYTNINIEEDKVSDKTNARKVLNTYKNDIKMLNRGFIKESTLKDIERTMDSLRHFTEEVSNLPIGFIINSFYAEKKREFSTVSRVYDLNGKVDIIAVLKIYCPMLAERDLCIEINKYWEMRQININRMEDIPLEATETIKPTPTTYYKKKVVKVTRVVNTPIEIDRSSVSFVSSKILLLEKAELLVLAKRLGLSGLTKLNKNQLLEKCRTRRSNQHFEQYVLESIVVK